MDLSFLQHVQSITAFYDRLIPDYVQKVIREQQRTSTNRTQDVLFVHGSLDTLPVKRVQQTACNIEDAFKFFIQQVGNDIGGIRLSQ